MKLVNNTCDLEGVDPKMLKPLSPSDEKLVQALCHVASLSGREFLYEHSSYMREVIPDPYQEKNCSFRNPDELKSLFGKVDLPDSTTDTLAHMTKLWIAHIGHILKSSYWNDTMYGFFALILVLMYAANEPNDGKREKLLLEFKSILTNMTQEKSDDSGLDNLKSIFDMILSHLPIFPA